jgi:hypothetical protein
MARRVLLAALLSALALSSAAGCGGSSGPSEESPGAFRKQANHICAAALAKLSSIAKPQTASQLPSYLRATLPVGNREIDDLQALRPPAAQRATYDAALAGARRESAVLTGLQHRLEAGAPVAQAFRSASRTVARVDTQVNAGFRRIGLQECAK